MAIEVASLPTTEYGEIIEIRVPVRFYWNPDGSFDGVEFGEFKTELQEWEVVMIDKCLKAIMPSIDKYEEDEDDNNDPMES